MVYDFFNNMELFVGVDVKDAVTEDGEILVYFPTEALKGFQPPEEWAQAIRQTHREKQQEKER